MGAANSRISETPSSNVFQNELQTIHKLVNSILNADNTFQNDSYNFLSDDVCHKYQVVLESDLSKHLKVDLSEFGSSIYVIPKDDTKSTNKKLNKSEICKKISDHYVRILYVLTLIKYVYNIENYGDRSFGGIIYRNIKIVNNLMEIQYCGSKQKDTSTASRKQTLDLGKLEGFKFFTKNILNGKESKAFMGLMRAFLGRQRKSDVSRKICTALSEKHITNIEFDKLSSLYSIKFGEPLVCEKKKHSKDDIESKSIPVDTNVVVSAMNPVFLKDYCTSIDNEVVDLSTVEGKRIKSMYDEMVHKYRMNMKAIQDILQEVVIVTNDGYELRDIDSTKLDDIIHRTKMNIRIFYMESILQYQCLLDNIKNIATVKVSINRDGFI